VRRHEAVAAAACLAATTVAIFVVGGAFRWVQAIVAGLLVIALAAIWRSRRVAARLSPLIGALGIAAALSALQLLPLPAGLIAQLEPVGAGLRDDGAALAQVSPWRALSLDAPGTLRGVTFFLILLAVAAVTVRMAVSERGRFRILASVAGLIGLAALVIGVHELVGATSLYGVYHPEQAHPSVLGPLLNENHLGGLMAMGAVLSMSLAMYRRQHSRLRAAWVVLAAACGAATVASQSRGATLALLAGAAMAGGLALAQRLFPGSEHRTRRQQLATKSLPIAAIVVSAVVVIIYGTAGNVSEQISRTSFTEIHEPKSKFAIWGSTAELLEESPWVGVGRGAFEPAFTRVHPAASIYSFSHVENEYLQAAADWGLPGAALIGLGCLWIAVVAARRWRDGPLVVAAVSCMVVVALQSAVDFGAELLGIAVPLTAVIATVTYVPLKESDSRQQWIARGVRTSHVLALVLCVPLLLADATRTVVEDHASLSSGSSLQLSDVAAATARHPLDYYPYALAAQILAREGNPQSVHFLNHALRLHPRNAALHHMAARMLYRGRHFEQAAIEYALALHTVPQRQPLLAEIASALPPKLAAAAIAADEPVETTVRSLLELKRGDVANEWLVRVLEASPGNQRACEWLYSASTHTGDLQAALSAGRLCGNIALSFAARVQVAQLLLSKGQPVEAIATVHDVESWSTRINYKISGWLVICDAYEAQDQLDEAKRCLRRLDVSGLVAPETREQLTSRLGRIEARQLGTATPH